MRTALLLLLLLIVFLQTTTCGVVAAAFSAASSSADAARQKLATALQSPSRHKLTLSPELVIPEPRDPTAILLLNSAVQNLSERIRQAKTNAAFVQCGGSVTALQTFCNEQAAALGNFPGPVPVVYCCPSSSLNDDTDDDDIDLEAIAQAGADGILVQVCGGKELSLDALDKELSSSSSKWIETCQQALAAGLQPIPEVTIGEDVASSWSSQQDDDDDGGVESMVNRVVDAVGSQPPVAILITVNPSASVASVNDDDENVENDKQQQQEQEEEEHLVTIPSIPKEGINIPILGSVRATAGDNRLSAETNRFQEAGFTGTVLRSDCVPGFRMQPDLEIVSRFWQSCITDLKSTRSKSFSFRSKNNMEKGAMSQWGSLQKSIIESGALGDPDDSYSIVDEAAGEYKGFA